jgi:hypothetical protein
MSATIQIVPLLKAKKKRVEAELVKCNSTFIISLIEQLLERRCIYHPNLSNREFQDKMEGLIKNELDEFRYQSARIEKTPIMLAEAVVESLRQQVISGTRLHYKSGSEMGTARLY